MSFFDGRLPKNQVKVDPSLRHKHPGGRPRKNNSLKRTIRISDNLKEIIDLYRKNGERESDTIERLLNLEYSSSQQ